VTRRGWSDPPFQKLPDGAPGSELAYAGPSPVAERVEGFWVSLNGTTYTNQSTAPAEALAIWQRHLEAIDA
jgi:hypothetical protein